MPEDKLAISEPISASPFQYFIARSKRKGGVVITITGGIWWAVDHWGRFLTAFKVVRDIPSVLHQIEPYATPALVVAGLILFFWDKFKKRVPPPQPPSPPAVPSVLLPVDAAKSLPKLPDRAGELAHDIFLFLNERPAPTASVSGDTYKDVRATLAANRDRLPNIHDGYRARFHGRVENVIYELGDQGIRDYELNALVNRHPHSDLDIKSIAEKLLSLGAQVVDKEYKSKFVAQSEMKQLPPMATSLNYDKPIWEAIVFVARRIGEEKDTTYFPQSRAHIRQEALNGNLTLWGRKQIEPPEIFKNLAEYARRFSEVLTVIPKEYWNISKLTEGTLAADYASLHYSRVWPSDHVKPALDAAWIDILGSW
jgi:hypothetical protein